MRITLFVPCYNEEKTICRSVESWLVQSRKPDQILVVDDSSTDKTPELLALYSEHITVVRTSSNLGNKSHAQSFGLPYITGDIIVMTDADTLLAENFIENIVRDFSDPKVAASSGYVKSLPHNWLTAIRALEYAVGQNIDKLAQSYLNYLLVIPGAAGAFRASVLKNEITFDHDTLTEDLDMTYKIHELGYKITFNREAVCFTQDPPNMKSYVNQLRRWYGGGWQNFLKHMSVPKKPGMAFELTLVYAEGLLFSSLLFFATFVNLTFSLEVMRFYMLILFCLTLVGYAAEKRKDFLMVWPLYIFLRYVNAWIFIEQFFRQVVLRKNNLAWFKADRINL